MKFVFEMEKFDFKSKNVILLPFIYDTCIFVENV